MQPPRTDLSVIYDRRDILDVFGYFCELLVSITRLTFA